MVRRMLALLLLASPAWATDTIGIGFGPSLDSSNLQPHNLNVRYEKAWGQFALEGNTHLLFAGAPFQAVVSIVPSAKIVTPSGQFLRCGVGLALASRLDSHISSPTNFNIECAGGLDVGRVEIYAQADHISNGTILGAGPNLGRDTIVAGIGYHLWK